MIALRGNIRHQSISKTQSENLNQAPPSSNGTPFNPLTAQDGEWIWTGHWAFGSLPEDDEIHAALNLPLPGVGRKPAKRKPPSGVRPFVYKFEKVVQAKDIVVPSSLGAGVSGSEGEGGDDGDVEQDIEGDGEKLGEQDEEEEEQEQEQEKDKKGDGTIKEEMNGGQEDEEMKDSNQKEEEDKNKAEDTTLVPKVDAAETESKVSAAATTESEESTTKKEQDGDVSMAHVSQEVTNATNDDQGDAANASNEEAASSDEHPLTEVKNENEKDADADANTDENTDANTDADADADADAKNNDKALPNSNEINVEGSHTEDAGKTNTAQTGSSFAEVEGGTFTDAGRDTFPDKCPVGGLWKGFFENVSVSQRQSFVCRF
jgi:hypothetical protein